MLVFPQLVTGAAAVYPVFRQQAARTVLNTLADGSTVVLADPDAGMREWTLRATALTVEEWTAVEALFQAVSGRLTTFTFLDPVGNLLQYSEAFGEPAWDNSPLIALTPGIDDPLGSLRATRVVNTGPTAGAVVQTLPVPGNFRYVLSVWAKTTAGSNVTLSAITAGGSMTRSFSLTNQWKRISAGIGLALNTESTTFGVELNAGASVDLFGMQVENQLAASDYKKTAGTGGVHQGARFADDELTVAARGTDMFDAVVRITCQR